MQPYQEKYIENVKEIAALLDVARGGDPETEKIRRIEAKKKTEILRKENIDLLNRYLFTCLDELHTASQDTIRELEEFSDVLMDWTANLDCGIYLSIHEALLTLYRFRKDRNNIIKELYKVGMGLYYQNRSVQGVESPLSHSLYFEAEMMFSEASSYLKYFAEIPDEETKGYIIRSLANIAICARDLKKRVDITRRVLQIVQDPYYRELAPGLPWDVFLQRTHQQMSSNRAVMSRGNLSAEELAAVLESCQHVFEPEAHKGDPNVRWLWPYYEMEYSCGFVDIDTTLDRMEKLIGDADEKQFDPSSMYANCQLPIYYGTLLKRNKNLRNRRRRLDFLKDAYDKMIRVAMAYPLDDGIDYFSYLMTLIITDYYETSGVPSYKEITTKLIRKLSGVSYLRSLLAQKIASYLCESILSEDPTFFDDIPLIKEEKDMQRKKELLCDYGKNCALYHDFGLLKMNLERLMRSRNLLEREYEIYQLHTVSGHDDLASRESTEIYADCAYGHHAWYDGSKGYPEEYVRNDSVYRQMTDVIALVSYLVESYDSDTTKNVKEILQNEKKRFSPVLMAMLMDDEHMGKIQTLLEEQ
jgi:hypothetical protein